MLFPLLAAFSVCPPFSRLLPHLLIPVMGPLVGLGLATALANRIPIRTCPCQKGGRCVGNRLQEHMGQMMLFAPMPAFSDSPSFFPLPVHDLL